MRYMTHPDDLALVSRLLGPWHDPCGDETSPAWSMAASAWSVRRGEDALLLSWPRDRPSFVNCPFNLCPEFLSKGTAESAATGQPVLFLIPAQVGSRYHRELLWPNATAACFANPRPVFLALEEDGTLRPAEHPTDCMFVLFGGELDHFAEVFGERGPIVRAVHRASRPQIERQPSLFGGLAIANSVCAC